MPRLPPSWDRPDPVRRCKRRTLQMPGVELRDLGSPHETRTPGSTSRSRRSLRSQQNVEQLWNNADTRPRKPWRSGRRQIALKSSQIVAPGCDGKEGVDGSSPSEGFAVQAAISAFLLSVLTPFPLFHVHAASTSVHRSNLRALGRTVARPVVRGGGSDAPRRDSRRLHEPVAKGGEQIFVEAGISEIAVDVAEFFEHGHHRRGEG